MSYYNANNLIFSERFWSLEEYVSKINARPISPQFQGVSELSSDASNGNNNFYASESLKHANRLARYGWIDGMQQAKKMESELGTPQSAELSTKPVIDYVGGMIVIPAYVANLEMARSGLPTKIMFNPSKPVDKPIIRVIVNTGILASCKTRIKMAKGVAIMALVKRLEVCGQRVELVAWKGTKDEGYWVENSTVIKAATQHLDMGIITYVFAHPSMNRRQGFRWIETINDKRMKPFIHGMGSTMELTDTEGGENVKRDMYITAPNSMDSSDPMTHYKSLYKIAIESGLIL